MKIDIHVHTKKCKQGDARSREIDPGKFCEIVLSTDVKILGITNHNVFDLDQFMQIESILRNNAQVWPGVELDIMDDSVRGHLLVIVSPQNASNFYESVLELTKDNDPDSFSTTIDKTLEGFDKYGPLYIAHYKQKKPAMSESSIETLINSTKNPCRVIKEVTNSISAGIYISHGHPSIYGSDVQNWEKYARLSSKLPDLRLPVESFDHFCLLLEKDPTTINTLLDKKTSEDLELYPFEDGSMIKLRAYNDINVIFGPKGTGKSCILRAISKHYSDQGMDAKVFTPASDELDEIFGINRKDITLNLKKFGINYCTDEIEAIRKAHEVDVTNVSNYKLFFRIKGSNRNAKKIRLKDIELEEKSSAERRFNGYDQSSSTVKDFLKFLNENELLKRELKESERTEVIKILRFLQSRLDKGKWKSFASWKKTHLLNSAIETCRREVSRKTGTPSKPSKTGFLDYARNRMVIEANINEINQNIVKPIRNQKSVIGSLGSNKGHMSFQTTVRIQDGSITDKNYLCISSVKKSTQKKFSKAVHKIAKSVYEEDLFERIAKLNDIDDVDDIKTINELLLFKKYFSLQDKEYDPSSGESSMVMLHKELEGEKDVYILDEPERSLDNEYINDVIVPLLKERARAGKRVFISTHDANIAVRTLPYSSVYRSHGPKGYDTFIGNPFSNDLINIHNKNHKLDWKQISMKTLEGGEEAFGERGKIYGNN